MARCLILPGLHDSGPDHWQTRWLVVRDDCQRVEFGRWSQPLRSLWVSRPDRGDRGRAWAGKSCLSYRGVVGSGRFARAAGKKARRAARGAAGCGAVIGGNVWLTESVGAGSVIHQASAKRERAPAGLLSTGHVTGEAS